MKNYEKQFYLAGLAMYDDARRFGWNSNLDQFTRFLSLAKLIKIGCDNIGWDPASLKIADYGCGDGYLFHVLNERGIGKSYYGIDAIKETTKAAEERAELLELDATFKCFAWNGIEELPMPWQPDFIVESGVFATTPAMVRTTMLVKLFEMPKIGFAGTFLMPSSEIEAYDGAIVPSPPVEIVRLVNNDLYSFVMLGDYLHHDFALGVYKRE
jgi:hypothetical protein